MIKKILLVNPPNTMPADSVRRIGEPLGLLYLASALKEHGYEVDLFDMACDGYDDCAIDAGYVTYGSPPEALSARIADVRPDLIGVSCLFTSREKNTFEVCKTIRAFNKDITIAVGGLHPSLFPERFLNKGYADYVVIGEGELRILHLIECINSGKAPSFDGVAYILNGSVRVNSMTSSINDLNSIPYPARELVDMERYIKIGTPFAPFSHEQRVAQILATRGCPQRCVFCSSVNYWGRKVRSRSVSNIIGEMKLLKEKYSIEEIQFVDDNMTADHRLAKELFVQMKDLGFKWCTPNGLMFNTIDAEMIKLMAESGAYQLTFAIESGSERVLKQIIHKNVNLERVKWAIDDAHKYDISVHGMFIVGFPGEKKEEIMQTLDFPFKAGFDSASFFVVNPLPGSELYDICNEKHYIVENYSAMDFKTANIKIPKDSADYNIEPEEIVDLVDKKTREFNEWSKKMYPDRWKKKFERYLKNHPDDKKIIMGRVT